MKKIYTFLGLLVIACLFTSCNQNDSETKSTPQINYNNYQVFGAANVAWTPDGTYYGDDDGYIHYLKNTGKQKFLYSKASDSSSNDYISCNNLLYYNNTLCAIEEKDNHDYVLYSMNKQGEDRHKYLTLSFSKAFDSVYGTCEYGSWGQSIAYCNNIFVVTYTDSCSTNTKDIVYWVSLDHPSEIHKLIQTQGIEAISPMKVSGHWFYSVNYTKKRTFELIGYNLDNGTEYILLGGDLFTEDKCCDFEIINDTDFYWFEMGKGLWHKDLTTDEVELLNDCSDMGAMVQACFMSGYVVVSNMVDYYNPIPPEDQSLLFLDIKGNEICHIDVKDPMVDYVGMIEDENNIYLRNVATGDLYTPHAYIKKSEIEDGTAKIEPIGDLD